MIDPAGNWLRRRIAGEVLSMMRLQAVVQRITAAPVVGDHESLGTAELDQEQHGRQRQQSA